MVFKVLTKSGFSLNAGNFKFFATYSLWKKYKVGEHESLKLPSVVDCQTAYFFIHAIYFKT